MRVIKSYSEGIKEASFQPKMIFILWLVNFVFGSVIYFLFYGLFSEAVGKSAEAESLLKKPDFNLFFEILVHRGESIRMIFSVALILILLYLLSSIFLHGGILFCLVHPLRKNSLENRRGAFAQAFFQGAGKFSGRFFRLMIYSLLLWAAFLILNLLLGVLVSLFTAQNGSERFLFCLFWIRVGFGLFLFFLISMILDYTRIKIVSEDLRHVFRPMLQTIKFVFQKLGRTSALYYLLLITGIFLFGIYVALKSIIPSDSLAAVILGFLLSQVFIVSRGWLRIAFQQAQLVFYSQRAVPK
jgi:hypothetical protein